MLAEGAIMPRKRMRKAERLRQIQERMGAANLEDISRTRRYVEREGLVAVMNDTKWEELIEAIRSHPKFTPQYRQKHVLAAEPAKWDGEWYLTQSIGAAIRRRLTAPMRSGICCGRSMCRSVVRTRPSGSGDTCALVCSRIGLKIR